MADSGLGEARIPIRAVLDKLDGDLARARSKMDGALGKMATTAQKVGKVALTGVAAGVIGASAAIGTFAINGINEFTNFQNQMNEVFTLLPDASQEAMGKMSNDVLRFSKEMAVVPNEVVPALYQSLSAGVPQDTVFDFLETAQKAAVGGITDLETSVDGITSVVNAYGEEVVGAAQASDIMFTTVRLGKTDFTQLSKSLFNVIPSAASLGISFEEVGASMATMTAQGTPTSVATTQLRALFVEASKDGSKLANAIENELGESFTSLTAKGVSANGILNDLRDSMPDDEFRNLFGSVEAMNAALATTGPNAELMTDNFDAMLSSVGATDKAFETMNKGIARSKERFKAFVSAALIQTGEALSPVINKVIELGERALPVVEDVLKNVTGFVEGFFLGLENGDGVIKSLFDSLYEWTDLTVYAGEELDAIAQLVEGQIVPAVTDFKDRVVELLAPIWEAISSFVSWKDIMITVGIIIASVILPIIWGLITTVASIAAPILAIIGVVALLRNAWEQDWGGIRTTLTEFYHNELEPILTQVMEWLQVNVPIALETLRAFWVDVAWPAIQDAVRIAWEIMKAYYSFLWDTLINVIIPAIADLYDYWVNVAWPAISQALTNAWAIIKPILETLRDWIVNTLIPTVQRWYAQWQDNWQKIKTALKNVWYTISTIFNEIGRWINDNLVPWINFFRDKWAKEVWPKIEEALTKAWGVIEPIWTSIQDWLQKTIPPILQSARDKWDEVFGSMEEKVSPVKEMVDKLKQAASDFWNFLSGHTFNFKINLPDLPDWAVPHSPLPIHTRWKEFGEMMNGMTIAPRVNMREVDQLARVELAGDTGPTKSVTYSSQTTVHTSADPMRVLRTSRYLDDLGDL